MLEFRIGGFGCELQVAGFRGRRQQGFLDWV